MASKHEKGYNSEWNNRGSVYMMEEKDDGRPSSVPHPANGQNTCIPVADGVEGSGGEIQRVLRLTAGAGILLKHNRRGQF